MLSFISSKATQVLVLTPDGSKLMPGSLTTENKQIEISPAKETPFSRLLIATTLVIYLCLLVALTGRSVFYLIQLRRHLRALPNAGEALKQEVSALALKLRMRRAPRLKTDKSAVTPFVTGLWRPTLVMPDAVLSGINSEVREALLIHELAHIRRGDILVRWIQNLARLLFFFWPPIWWVCRRLERYAEIACDEWAIRFSSVNPEAYAEALLVIARGVRVRPWRGSAVGLSSTVGTMTARFERILRAGDERSPRMSWLILAFMLCWGVFVLSGSALARHSEISSTPISAGVIATQNRTVTSVRTSSTESRQERPQVRAKTQSDKRRVEELEILAQRGRAKPTPEPSVISEKPPSSNTSVTQVTSGSIDLNGDGIISDFEAGYSAAQTFISSRARGGSDAERRREIEKRAQEEQALRNRPPNNR